MEEQAVPNGNFPTVKSPNPEDTESLEMALRLAKENDSDIFIGTDPDADRLGIGIKDDYWKYITLNGNQIKIVLT